MGYETYPKLPAFSECLLSLWFRIPNETFDNIKAKKPIGTEPDEFPEFNKVTPLVVFGGARHRKKFEYTHPLVSSGPNISTDSGGEFIIVEGHWEMQSSHSAITGDHYLDPAYIGINQFGELEFNLQLAQTPDARNYFFDPEGVLEIDVPPTPPPGLTLRTFGPRSAKDVSVLDLLRGAPEAYFFTVPLHPTPDQWHHVLLSINLGSKVQVTSAEGFDISYQHSFTNPSKVFLAVDDVPIDMRDTGPSLGFYGQPNDGSIMSNAQFNVATTPIFPDSFYAVRFQLIPFDRPIDPISGLAYGFSDMVEGVYTISPLPPVTYLLTKPAIAAGTLAFPAPGRFTKSIYRCEMAECHMWVGKSVDARQESIRRLFVKDDGKPNLDAKARAKALGEPDIILHKSGNWKKGKNTGKSKVNFAPKGKILRWRPDPSLRGDQTPDRRNGK